MTILDTIFAAKRKVAATRSASDLAEMQSRAKDAAPVRGFLNALQSSQRAVALIAEVKKASPVGGVIRAGFDPVSIAREYEGSGATALSVLTDVEFFQGSNENLTLCREATRLPVLRKDFTTCPYDLYEARAIGADAILLIVNGLEQGETTDLRLLA